MSTSPRSHPVIVLVAALLMPCIADAQAALTISDAMARARGATADARGLQAATQESAERVRQARADYLPRVDLAETIQRGDHPVFVFSSLLAQRQFTAANFAIDELNHPSALTNTRTAITVDQRLWDGGSTRLAVSRAAMTRDLSVATTAAATQDLAVRAAQAFVRVLQLEAAARASAAAVEAAESDRMRAQARRDLGVATDGDVLAVEVHLADVRQQQLATAGDLAVSRLTLNDAIGAPLDAMFALVAPAAPASSEPVDTLVHAAMTARPERRQADLRVALADNDLSTARAAFLPRIGVQGGWEFNGERITDQRSSWLVGAQVQINLFRGFGDDARMAEARQTGTRAAAERDKVTRSIEIDVRSALARLAAARARANAGQASRTQARESQRIVRDRYDNGLASITDVLRAAEAVLDADARATAADMAVIAESIALDRAVGRLQ